MPPLRHCEYLPIPTTGAAVSRLGVCCLKCHSSLAVHQPDPGSPERLLGTCESCGSWHLIDETEAVLIRLPDCRTFRKVIASSRRRSRKRSPLAG
jgi:hypothetical protein